MTKYLLIALAACLLIMGLGWWHIGNQADTIKAQQTSIAQLEADKAALDQKLTARDSVDTQFQEAIAHAESEKNKLVAQLGTGERRVYVRATCPKLPNPSATGSADAGTPELDPTARQDYADLRAAIIRTREQVTGLQSYITNVCRSAK
ncbi:lysis system i-spanin subunit Rz [Pseudomonas typographi]|uniref:Lysis protein n=1 Tax=Pseudomonas typographi TaxID=2715964 RepID=A0ABR7Z9J0_9PSED|nr:lysis protein [Pseudomonas typographi]